MKLKIFTLIVLSLFCLPLSAAEKSPENTIKRLISYSEYGEGDIYVSLNTNGPSCSYGYYINKNRQGYDANLSMLLAAYHSKSKIYIQGITENRWAGSSNPVCEIYSVEYGNN